jgi:hypothetical protein
MLKVFIDGENFQDQLRALKFREGHEFNKLKLVKIDHDRLGKWDVYFETGDKNEADRG